MWWLLSLGYITIGMVSFVIAELDSDQFDQTDQNGTLLSFCAFVVLWPLIITVGLCFLIFIGLRKFAKLLVKKPKTETKPKKKKVKVKIEPKKDNQNVSRFY